MKQHSHDLKGIEHVAANISSSQVPTQEQTEDSYTVKSKKREDSLSICNMRGIGIALDGDF